jgi:hypothetical protein
MQASRTGARSIVPLLLLSLLAMVVGCGDGATTSGGETSPEQSRIGFEIIEIRSDGTQKPWISPEITREEFEALEVPVGWRKNQPRERDPDISRFTRSPDEPADGEFVWEELFGFDWRYSANVVELGLPIGGDGELIAVRVNKYHELTFFAGSTVTVLLSPEGDAYFRMGRDANGASDEAKIPDSWRLVEYTTPDRMVIQLFGGNVVIRTSNQDSFQGPVPGLSALLSRSVARVVARGPSKRDRFLDWSAPGLLW